MAITPASTPPRRLSGVFENLTVPERTERVEAADTRIKNLGPCQFESPLAARFAHGQLHPVGEADRVLIDDRFSRIAGGGASRTVTDLVADLPTFELAGPRDRVFFDPRNVRCGGTARGRPRP